MSENSILRKFWVVDAADSPADDAPGLTGLVLANDNVPPQATRIASDRLLQFAFKRTLDIAGALTGLTILAPFMMMVAVLIRLESKGPVFFRQLRTGKDGVPFEILKFRTMYVDLCDHGGRQQTIDDDPRVTRIGRILRRTSLDEIPQLWNILVGHMSLVGPRPHVPDMLAAGVNYADLVENYEMRHGMRPGLTGLAQARGLRGPTTDRVAATRRIASDIEYIRTFSLLLDLKILLRTLVNEIRGGTGS